MAKTAIGTEKSAYGSWIGTDDWRSWVGITVTSETDTTATIKVRGWMDVGTYGSSTGNGNVQGWVGYSIGSGAKTWDPSGSTGTYIDPFSPNSGWYFNNGKTWTITKTTSEQTIKGYADVEGVTGFYSGYKSLATASVVIAAKAITSYTVSYDKNGGSGSVPSSQTKTKGTALTLSNSPLPTRTGYTFLGWNTSKTASSATYCTGTDHSSNRSYTTDANATMYAIWRLNTYTITYNANGGTGAPAAQTKNHGQALTLRTTQPTRNGYAFLGWSTSSTATTAAYTAGGTLPATINQNTILYAVWSRTITYNGNGNTGGSTTASTATGNTALTIKTNGFTKTHWDFSKWNTKADGTGTDYNAGVTYTGGSITLYAIWTPKTEYTISYHIQSGVVEEVTGLPEDQIKYHGETLKLTTDVPQREDSSTGVQYFFNKWSTSSNPSTTGTLYSSGGNFTANQTTSLYATWTSDPSEVVYTYTFNANGGSWPSDYEANWPAGGTTGTYPTISKVHKNTATLPSVTPQRTNYIFTGWALEEDADWHSVTEGESFYLAGGTCNEQQDTIFYAVWTPIPYNIIFNTNAPLDNDNNPYPVYNMPITPQIKRYEEDFTIPSNIPYVENYNFRFWSTAINPTEEQIENANTDENSIWIYHPEDIYTENASLTLYPVWELADFVHIQIYIGETVPQYGWIDLYSQNEWDKGIYYEDAGANSAHIMWFAHSKLQALKFKIDDGT